VHTLQHLTSGVLADIIRRQPSSPARTAFAWQLTVGPALARATTVELADGVLIVRSSDARWTLEVTRARAVVVQRLQHFLGAEAVTSLRIDRSSRSR